MASSQFLRMGVFSLLLLVSIFSVGSGHRVLWSKDGLTISTRDTERAGINALDYTLEANGKVILRGKLGLALPEVTGLGTNCDAEDATQCVQWGDFAKLKITSPNGTDNCGTIEWHSTFGRRLEDCFELEEGVHWYGGAETRVQTWPIEGVSRAEHPYVTGDFLQDFQFGGLLETYWLSSSGVALHVAEETPLSTSWNTAHPGHFCLVSQDRLPHKERNEVSLKYDICSPKAGENFKDVHVRSLARHYERPSGIPDERMIVHPFWSTWAQYKTEVNATIVIELAKRMIAEGYTNNSHIEIDDDWESCLGEAEFNLNKFPDPAAMVRELAELGIDRTTMWVHPFINYDCPSFDYAINNDYFVKDSKSKPTVVWWWRGQKAGAIDYTNADAIKWWSGRLQNLQDKYNITSFKFDAGETFWLSQSSVLNGDSNLFPNLYSTKYVEAVSAFGGMVETRAAHRNQKLPIFIRMLDKDSVWDENNGLRSLIPTLLLFNVLGYSYVLPDMIGGNAYGGFPNPELYIRWAQANVFMPAWQFSVLPWDIDSTGQLDRIVKEAVELRERYGSKLLEAARLAVTTGEPMNRPIWWVDPEDPVTHNISDQFMLGDDILVAPVVHEGATSRNIYLPKGTWRAELSSGTQTYVGPRWLENFPAPLDVLPFFTKQA